MPAVMDYVFKALSDPTRRAIFEHLARDYEGDREQVNAIDAFLASVAVSAPWSRRQ